MLTQLAAGVGVAGRRRAVQPGLAPLPGRHRQGFGQLQAGRGPRGRPVLADSGRGLVQALTVAVSANASAVGRSGAPPVPPAARVDAVPTAQPSRAADGRSRPRSSPAISPALKQSPAPVASTTGPGTPVGGLIR